MLTVLAPTTASLWFFGIIQYSTWFAQKRTWLVVAVGSAPVVIWQSADAVIRQITSPVLLITAAVAALAPLDVTITGVPPKRIKGMGFPFSSRFRIELMIISY